MAPLNQPIILMEIEEPVNLHQGENRRIGYHYIDAEKKHGVVFAFSGFKVQQYIHSRQTTFCKEESESTRSGSST